MEIRADTLLAAIERYWAELERPGAVSLGIGLGVTTGILPHILLGWPPLIPGFFLLFPFFARFVIQLPLVLVSYHHQERLLGRIYPSLLAPFALLGRKYSLFCLAWHFTMILYLIMIGEG